MNREVIYFAKLDETTIVPSKRDEDAGYDIYANFKEDYMVILPNETKLIPTKLASVCSADFRFQLWERGSTGTKGMGQRCGVIDSGYRNEWIIPITNHNNIPIVIIKKDVVKDEKLLKEIAIMYPYEKAIAQATLERVEKGTVKEITAEELKNFKSERGLGRLGSSGK